jgi:nucleoside-diphosphate-sugar epimerase|tara:strand:- start:45 stop:1007 length:963 start_codon:yes stop_codon:yes gene_type:complete
MEATTGNRILVTGALGQIGTELVEALRARFGIDAVVASDVRDMPDHPVVIGGHYRHLSVIDADAFDAVIVEEGIGLVYHLAALLSATAEKLPELAERVNVGGLITVLEAARKHSLRVYAPSSIAVFGPDSPNHAPQVTPLNPTTVYGRTKVTGERLARNYWNQYGIDVRGIRYPGLISYKAPAGGGTTDYAVDIFHEALANGHYDCFVRADTRLPMMYMDDAIRATISLMDAPAESLGEPRVGYNVAGISFTAAELADAVAARVPDFTCDFKPDVRQEYADSWPDSIDDELARQDWGWRAEYDLDELCDTMIAGLQLSSI